MKPDKPVPKPPIELDPFLDSLPQPDVIESNTDTAWGLWENTLKAQDEPLESGKAANKGKGGDFKDSDYPQTQPGELKDFFPIKKKSTDDK